MRFLSEKEGFTLLELVVVLFIIAVAAGLVAVAVGKSFEKAVLRDEAMRLRNTLRHARELALLERTPSLVKLDSEQNAYWIELNEAKQGSVHALPRNVALRTDGEVAFFPKGQSSGGEVLIEDENKRGYIIEVDPVTGEPKLRRIQPS
jgi:general secretion pathway protein H